MRRRYRKVGLSPTYECRSASGFIVANGDDIQALKASCEHLPGTISPLILSRSSSPVGANGGARTSMKSHLTRRCRISGVRVRKPSNGKRASILNGIKDCA